MVPYGFGALSRVATGRVRRAPCTSTCNAAMTARFFTLTGTPLACVERWSHWSRSDISRAIHQPFRLSACGCFVGTSWALAAWLANFLSKVQSGVAACNSA